MSETALLAVEPKPGQPQIDAASHVLRRRRRIGVAMIVTGSALLLAIVWLAVTALMARSQLNQVRAQAQTLRAEITASDWPAAQATVTELKDHAHRAQQLTSGPVWALAAAVPSGGEPLQSIRGITAGIDTLAQDALPQLVSAIEKADPQTLRRRDGSIDLARLAAVRPALSSASATMSKTTKTISELPRQHWLKSLDSMQVDALSQFTTLDSALKSADLAMRIVPSMLGQDGPKSYFLAFQNESEARGTGGLPGAFAIVEANRGKLRFTRMESDTALVGITAKVDLGPEFAHLYDGAGPTQLFGNSNVSPHFPYAAQVWASMWEKYSGEKLDGALAVDPTALGYLLDVTGPATLPDKSQITGANAAELTQSTSYAKFGGLSDAAVAERRAYLLDIASASSKKVLGAHGDPMALVRAVSQAASERRLLVWSADAGIQEQLEQTPVAGIIPSTSAPYVGLSVVNGGGNKLDYYLDRSLTWRRTGCGSTRQVVVTITLANNAPAGELPPYVTGRNDTHSYPVKPGDNRLQVSYFATKGAILRSATVAGRPARGRTGAERGHPVYMIDVEVPRGRATTTVLRLSEPAGTGNPIVLRQPLVRPLNVSLDNAVCR